MLARSREKAELDRWRALTFLDAAQDVKGAFSPSALCPPSTQSGPAVVREQPSILAGHFAADHPWGAAPDGKYVKGGRWSSTSRSWPGS